MSEGLDLADDLARWQVIVKAPFPNLGDPWVVRKHAEPGGKSWYSEQTVIDLLQASGRVMRSRKDRGVTYILDKKAERVLRQQWVGLPDWFKARVAAGADISTPSGVRPVDG
jgi:Rad3-related DNA helicase